MKKSYHSLKREVDRSITLAIGITIVTVIITSLSIIGLLFFQIKPEISKEIEEYSWGDSIPIWKSLMIGFLVFIMVIVIVSFWRSAIKNINKYHKEESKSI